MTDDQLIDQHVSQLAASRSPVYGLLSSVRNAQARREAGLLLDQILSEQLPAVGSLPPEDAIGVLHASLQAARPDRRCMHYLLKAFPEWERSIAPHARKAFLEVLPTLAPAVYDLNDEGMRQVLEAAAGAPEILRPVAAYAMTTAEAIRALAFMAGQAARHRRVDLLEAFAEAFPAARMEESREAERLPQALHRMQNEARAWPEAMQLCLVLVKRDISAARGAAAALTSTLRKLPAAHHAGFLEDMRLVVESVGVRAAGLCVRTLPGLYQRHDAGAVRRFVSLACQTATQAGALAGEAFLERGTEASRRILA